MCAYFRLAAAWLLIAALTAFASPVAPEKFAGTWEAKAKGTVFLVLKISAGQKISGTMKAGKVHLDDAGDVLQFELKLTGDNAGELRIVDKDHPGLKGFAIKKV